MWPAVATTTYLVMRRLCGKAERRATVRLERVRRRGGRGPDAGFKIQDFRSKIPESRFQIADSRWFNCALLVWGERRERASRPPCPATRSPHASLRSASGERGCSAPLPRDLQRSHEQGRVSNPARA